MSKFQNKEEIDTLEHLFQQHYIQVSKLKFRLWDYIGRVTDSSSFLKRLSKEISEFYQENWPNSETFFLAQEDQEKLWNMFKEDLINTHESIINYQKYLDQFQEHLESLQKKHSEVKAAKRILEYSIKEKQSKATIEAADEKLHRKRRLYERIYKDVTSEFPKVMSSRISFIVQIIGKLFRITEDFCKMNAEVQKVAKEILKDLHHSKVDFLMNKNKDAITLIPYEKSRSEKYPINSEESIISNYEIKASKTV